MRLVYHLTDTARQRLFVETGNDPGKAHALSVEPALLSREDRALLAERNPTLGEQITLTYPDWTFYAITKTLELNETVDDPATLLAAYRDAAAAGRARVFAAEEQKIAAEIERLRAWNDSREPGTLNRSLYQDQPRRQEWIEAHAAAVLRARELAQQAAEAKRRDEERRAAEAKRRDEERAAWARAHGSAHLRKCVEMNYDCQRIYVLERAAREFPGYVVDYYDKAAWKDRSGPSEAALDEAARVNGIVVWLTEEPSSTPAGAEEWAGEGFEPCEAVVIRGFLGQYDLIKTL